MVSGLTGLFNCSGMPPSFRILAFLRCRRRSWFFFILAISSSSLYPWMSDGYAGKLRFDLPFLGSGVLFSVAGRCQGIRCRVLFFQYLPFPHVCRDNCRIANNLVLRMSVNLEQIVSR